MVGKLRFPKVLHSPGKKVMYSEPTVYTALSQELWNTKKSHPDPIQSRDKATWLVHGLPGLPDPAAVTADPGQWDWRNSSEWDDNNTLDVDKELPHCQKEEKSKIQETENHGE